MIVMLTAEERFENLHKQLNRIDDYLVKLLNENNELKARNEELEKENEKLHDIILNMSQKK